MSLAGLYDHTVRAYALVPVDEDEGGAVLYTPEPLEAVPTTHNAKYTRWDHDLRTTGVGDVQTGTGWVSRELPCPADMERADIIQVIAGPDAPAILRIVSITNPRGHHVKAVVRPYEADIDLSGAS